MGRARKGGTAERHSRQAARERRRECGPGAHATGEKGERGGRREEKKRRKENGKWEKEKEGRERKKEIEMERFAPR